MRLERGAGVERTLEPIFRDGRSVTDFGHYLPKSLKRTSDGARLETLPLVDPLRYK